MEKIGTSVNPKVAVLVLGYNSKKNIDDCFPNLTKQTYKNYQVIFADNNSLDGAAEYIEKLYPQVKVYKFKNNTGYAGGNNKLLKIAFKFGAKLCLLINSDVRVEKNLVADLVESYKNKKKQGVKIGLIQPTIMLFNKPNLINSAGNVIHYLGFGYCGSYLSKNIPKVDKEIISVSGTAMLISREYYEDIGELDEDFFMYNEDQNYCWRGSMREYKHFLSVKPKIWHKYEFTKNNIKWYNSEKNRLLMLFENYQLKTLMILLPIILINECLVMVFACMDGWFISKIRSYIYLIRNLQNIRNKRRIIQHSRILEDKILIRRFSSILNFSEKNNIHIRNIINPIYNFYYNLALKVI